MEVTAVRERVAEGGYEVMCSPLTPSSSPSSLTLQAADSVEVAAAAPFVEKLVADGYEVLYLTEAIDEAVVTNLGKYNDLELVDVSKEGLDLPGGEEDAAKVRGLLGLNIWGCDHSHPKYKTAAPGWLHHHQRHLLVAAFPNKPSTHVFSHTIAQQQTHTPAEGGS